MMGRPYSNTGGGMTPVATRFAPCTRNIRSEAYTFSVEALEGRILLSSAKLIDGTLQVTANPGASNQISVYISGNHKNVEVSIMDLDGYVWLLPFARGVVKAKRV